MTCIPSLPGVSEYEAEATLEGVLRWRDHHVMAGSEAADGANSSYGSWDQTTGLRERSFIRELGSDHGAKRAQLHRGPGGHGQLAGKTAVT